MTTKWCCLRDGYGDDCGRPVVPSTTYCEPCLTRYLPDLQKRAAALRAELEATEEKIRAAEEALEAASWTERTILIGHVVLGR